MKLETIVVFLAATFFVAYGLAFAVAPNATSGAVTGLTMSNVSALVDFRATYGGMTVAVGLVTLYLHHIQQSRACLVTIVIVLMSMACTRALGFVVDGSGNLLMGVYLALELLGSLLAWIALRQSAHTPSHQDLP